MHIEQLTLFPADTTVADTLALVREARELLDDGHRPFSTGRSMSDGGPIAEPPEPGSHDEAVDQMMRTLLDIEAVHASAALRPTAPAADEPF
jgi:hypothetical protein